MKKSLYIILVPLLITEWVIDTIRAVWVAFHTNFTELVLALQKYINEPTKPKPPKEGL